MANVNNPAPIPTLQDQIDYLTAESQAVKEYIAKQKKAADDAQAALADATKAEKNLTTKLQQLQKLADQFKAQEQKLSEAVQQATHDKDAAEECLADIEAEVKAQLSYDHQQAIEKCVTDADDASAELEKIKDKMQDELKVQSEAQAEARKEAAIAEEYLNYAQNYLKQFPKEIQAAHNQVKKIQGLLTAAFNKNQLTEAYILAQDLHNALDELESLIDPAFKTHLTAALERSSQVHNEAQENLKKTTAAVEAAQKDLTEAENNLKSHIQQRDQNIRVCLAQALPNC